MRAQLLVYGRCIVLKCHSAFICDAGIDTVPSWPIQHTLRWVIGLPAASCTRPGFCLWSLRHAVAEELAACVQMQDHTHRYVDQS